MPVGNFDPSLKGFLKIFKIENFENLALFGFLIRGFSGAYRYENVYSLDIVNPLTAVQGFALAISSHYWT